MSDGLCILTCEICGGKNERALPYSMIEPDECEHCGRKFRTRMSVAVMRYRQSKLSSWTEAVVNTFVGLVIAFAAQWLICWVYDIPLSATHNFIIVFWMTIISVLRSYGVRRIFNGEPWRRK